MPRVTHPDHCTVIHQDDIESTSAEITVGLGPEEHSPACLLTTAARPRLAARGRGLDRPATLQHHYLQQFPPDPLPSP